MSARTTSRSALSATGVVTFTQLLNIWHDDTANPDDPETLTTAAGNLKLTQTVTDADGDSVHASIDLGTGVFTIQDDGPVQNTVIAAADTLVLDESAVGTDTAGGTLRLGWRASRRTMRTTSLCRTSARMGRAARPTSLS